MTLLTVDACKALVITGSLAGLDALADQAKLLAVMKDIAVERSGATKVAERRMRWLNDLVAEAWARLLEGE